MEEEEFQSSIKENTTPEFLVIDKDRLSSLLAIEMGVDALIISTAVDAVKAVLEPNTKKIHNELTVSEAEKYLEQGEFAELYGSACLSDQDLSHGR